MNYARKLAKQIREDTLLKESGWRYMESWGLFTHITHGIANRERALRLIASRKMKITHLS